MESKITFRLQLLPTILTCEDKISLCKSQSWFEWWLRLFCKSSAPSSISEFFIKYVTNLS